MTLNEANLFFQDQRLWHCNNGLVGSKQEKPVLLMPDGVYWEAVRRFAGGRQGWNQAWQVGSWVATEGLVWETPLLEFPKPVLRYLAWGVAWRWPGEDRAPLRFYAIRPIQKGQGDPCKRISVLSQRQRDKFWEEKKALSKH